MENALRVVLFPVELGSDFPWPTLLGIMVKAITFMCIVPLPNSSIIESRGHSDFRCVHKSKSKTLPPPFLEKIARLHVKQRRAAGRQDSVMTSTTIEKYRTNVEKLNLSHTVLKIFSVSLSSRTLAETRHRQKQHCIFQNAVVSPRDEIQDLLLRFRTFLAELPQRPPLCRGADDGRYWLSAGVLSSVMGAS